MKTIIILSIGFLSLPVFAKLNVYTTTTTLKSIVSEIGKDLVFVESFTKGQQDPHYVEAKPSLMVKAKKADLLVSVGLELELGWLPNLIRGARSPKIQAGSAGSLITGEYITPIEVPRGKVDRAEGDVHASGNPHYHFNPDLVLIVAEKIKDKLMELDPQNKESFSSNYNVFTSRLKEKTLEWEKRLNVISDKKVVTYHKNFSYFFNRFNIRSIGTLEPKPGLPPTAKHIVNLVGRIRSENVVCIFNESYYEKTAAMKIKKQIPVEVIEVGVEVEALSNIQTYFDLIEEAVKAVELCYQKQG